MPLVKIIAEILRGSFHALGNSLLPACSKHHIHTIVFIKLLIIIKVVLILPIHFLQSLYRSDTSRRLTELDQILTRIIITFPITSIYGESRLKVQVVRDLEIQI